MLSWIAEAVVGSHPQDETDDDEIDPIAVMGRTDMVEWVGATKQKVTVGLDPASDLSAVLHQP